MKNTLRRLIRGVDRGKKSPWFYFGTGVGIGLVVALTSPFLLLAFLLSLSALFWLLNLPRLQHWLYPSGTPRRVFFSCADASIPSWENVFLEASLIEERWHSRVTAAWLVEAMEPLPPVGTLEEVIAIAATIRKEATLTEQIKLVEEDT